MTGCRFIGDILLVGTAAGNDALADLVAAGGLIVARCVDDDSLQSKLPCHILSPTRKENQQ
jgi:hypothetical protein